MPENIIICGGGVKIMAYIGAIAYLHEINALHNIRNFYGVSAGGILATMLAIGYTIHEIKDFMNNFDFTKVVADIDPSIVFDEYAISKGHNMEVVTKSVIVFKLGKDNLDYSFKQLYQDKNIKLLLSAFNVTQNRMTYFDHTSDTPIWKALVASCRLPFLFTPFRINDDAYLDGGTGDNFPIHLIPKHDIIKSIGIYSDFSQNSPFKTGFGFIDYTLNIMSVFTSSNYYQLLSFYHPIIINIPSPTSCINFDIDNTQKNVLYELGYNCAKEQMPQIQQFWESISEKGTQTE